MAALIAAGGGRRWLLPSIVRGESMPSGRRGRASTCPLVGTKSNTLFHGHAGKNNGLSWRCKWSGRAGGLLFGCVSGYRSSLRFIHLSGSYPGVFPLSSRPIDVVPSPRHQCSVHNAPESSYLGLPPPSYLLRSNRLFSSPSVACFHSINPKPNTELLPRPGARSPCPLGPPFEPDLVPGPPSARTPRRSSRAAPRHSGSLSP